MVAGINPAAVFPLHANVGGARVVPLKHCALGAFDTWNYNKEEIAADDSF